MIAPSFRANGPARPNTPVVISVPHAGRDYRAIEALLCVSPRRIRALEDRFADRLVEQAVASGTPSFVALSARAWVDLNRDEADLDVGMIVDRAPAPLSARARGGLGLIPRRFHGVEQIWRAPLTAADLAERVTAHRAWHAAIAQSLRCAQDQFGFAVLLDIHSMPTLGRGTGPDIVIGDAFGESAGGWMTATANGLFHRRELRTALNAPYAGGYAVRRHGRPANGFYALQIEFDRALYLDAANDACGSGLPRMQGVIVDLVETLGAALSSNCAIAAE